MEAEEATSSTPQSSVVSSVVVVESKRVERPAETSRSSYLEKLKELDLEDLECRQELAEALGLERVSHEDLSRLVEGSRDAFLKSENNGDGGSDWDSHKISHRTYQLRTSQVAGESGTHSGAP